MAVRGGDGRRGGRRRTGRARAEVVVGELSIAVRQELAMFRWPFRKLAAALLKRGGEKRVSWQHGRGASCNVRQNWTGLSRHGPWIFGILRSVWGPGGPMELFKLCSARVIPTIQVRVRSKSAIPCTIDGWIRIIAQEAQKFATNTCLTCDTCMFGAVWHYLDTPNLHSHIGSQPPACRYRGPSRSPELGLAWYPRTERLRRTCVSQQQPGAYLRQPDAGPAMQQQLAKAPSALASCLPH